MAPSILRLIYPSWPTTLHSLFAKTSSALFTEHCCSCVHLINHSFIHHHTPYIMDINIHYSLLTQLMDERVNYSGYYAREGKGKGPNYNPPTLAMPNSENTRIPSTTSTRFKGHHMWTPINWHKPTEEPSDTKCTQSTEHTKGKGNPNDILGNPVSNMLDERPLRASGLGVSHARREEARLPLDEISPNQRYVQTHLQCVLNMAFPH